MPIENPGQSKRSESPLEENLQDKIEDRTNKPEQTIIESEVKDFEADSLAGLLDQFKGEGRLQGSDSYSFADITKRVKSTINRIKLNPDMPLEERNKMLSDIPRVRGLRKLTDQLLKKERTEIIENEIRRVIESSNSFETLLNNLKVLGGLKGTPDKEGFSRFYSFEDLKKQIGIIEAGGKNEITRTGGLRKHIDKLLAEKIKKDIGNTIKY
jgi:hypothetical protein